MPDTDALIASLHASHDRLAGIVAGLDEKAVQGPSYADEWSIAQVASHLGSGAEIFGLLLEAGLSESAPPEGARFQAIWAVWDAREPAEQVAESVAANAAFLARVDGVPRAGRDGFLVQTFAGPTDLARLTTMRLGEHALHSWDIAVALDPAAQVAPDAVALLIDDMLAGVAARAGKPEAQPRTIVVETSEPARTFVLTTGPAVTLAPAPESGSDVEADARLSLPAEALVRLVYGRLDEAHTPDGIGGADLLPGLRAVFPGF
ncbi:MAG TPA: maleylpyruvate isomerase family mycothiol-dependent enzyme [Actinocrinis sp.]|jgi:uncharacterized protein (TIGR03083 family)